MESRSDQDETRHVTLHVVWCSSVTPTPFMARFTLLISKMSEIKKKSLSPLYIRMLPEARLWCWSSNLPPIS